MKHEHAVTITGVSGFVGSVLAKEYLKRGDTRVFGADIVEPDRLGDMADDPNFSFEAYDVNQPLHSDLLAVDTLYHFSGIANPATYVNDPLRVMDLNIMGLRNILDRIDRWSSHRPRIVYSSTSETYGKNMNLPFDELDTDMVFGQTDKTRWVYALTKATCEHYLKAFEKRGINHTVFRFFNFVGRDIDAPGQGRVITKMVESALTKGEIGVALPGDQTRCFTWEDDFVVPLVRAGTYKKEKSGYKDHSYTLNLGTEEEISMRELAVKIRQVLYDIGTSLDFPKTIEIVDYDPTETIGKGYEDIPRRVPSVQRARDVLDWEATMKLDEFLPIIVDSICDKMGVMA